MRRVNVVVKIAVGALLIVALMWGDAERFSDNDGRVRATFDIIWLSGWAPHASQQTPLKPGSARMRLAEALQPGSGASATIGDVPEPDGPAKI